MSNIPVTIDYVALAKWIVKGRKALYHNDHEAALDAFNKISLLLDEGVRKNRDEGMEAT